MRKRILFSVVFFVLTYSVSNGQVNPFNSKTNVEMPITSTTSTDSNFTEPISNISDEANIKHDSVIVRSGPGINNSKIIKVTMGTSGRRLEEKNGWTKVDFGKGIVGWVRSDMVQQPKRKAATPTVHLPKGKVTSHSPKFKKWFAKANEIAQTWDFPNVKNKFGKTITTADYLRAIIWIESRGIHKKSSGKITKSWVGALGFMQLMPRTAKAMNINPKNPAENLKGGAKYFKLIFKSRNNRRHSGGERLVMAAAAYNIGPYSKSLKKNWKKFLKGKVSKETKIYGLKMKMCLGLSLSSNDRKYIKKLLVNGKETVDSVVKQNYAYSHAIGQ